MIYTKSFCLLLLILLNITITNAQDLVPLQRNVSTAVQLGAGQVYHYSVALQKGQIATIEVEQQSVGIGYAVYDPKDSLIINEDLNALYQREIISIAANKTGIYKIDIFWDYGRPQKGSFIIKWNKLETINQTTPLQAAQWMNSWYTDNAPGAAIAVIQKGKLVYKACKGLSNLEYKIPITSSSPFELASCSKQFTGFAIAQLIVEGKISLKDDIRMYLPELPDYGTSITIENLVYHTSGLRDWDALTNAMGFRPNDPLNLEMIYHLICTTRTLNFKPGEQFAYSNTGYNLLALIVEKVTHVSFGAWVKDHIFIPLRMKNSFVKESNEQIIPHKVSSYNKAANGWIANPDNYALMGSSSIYTSLDDLMIWVRYLETLEKKMPPLFALLNRKTKLNNGEEVSFYAFGNGFGTHKGVKNIEHLGLVSGFRTAITRYPAQDLTIIFLTNDNNDASYHRSWRIGDLFLKHLINLPLEPIVFPDLQETLAATMLEAKPCPVDPQQYVGVYFATEINTHYTITVQNGVLIAQSFQLDEIPLSWEKDEIFNMRRKPFNTTFNFERNKEQHITGFQLLGAEKAIFFRKQKQE